MTPYTSLAAEGGKCVQGAGAATVLRPLRGPPVSSLEHLDPLRHHLATAGPIRLGADLPRRVRPETGSSASTFSPTGITDARRTRASTSGWMTSVSTSLARSHRPALRVRNEGQLRHGLTAHRTGAAHPLYANAYNDLVERSTTPGSPGSAGKVQPRSASANSRVHGPCRPGIRLSAVCGGTGAAADLLPAAPPYYPCARARRTLGAVPCSLRELQLRALGEFFGLGNALLTNPERVGAEGPLGVESGVLLLDGLEGQGQERAAGMAPRDLPEEGFSSTIHAINGPLDVRRPRMAERRQDGVQGLLPPAGCRRVRHQARLPVTPLFQRRTWITETWLARPWGVQVP